MYPCLSRMRCSRPKEGSAIANNIVLFQSSDREISLDVLTDGSTVWVTQSQMAELFERDRTVIARHVSNIYREGEVDKDSTCAKFAQVQGEGDREVSRIREFYNLDVIISVGYRVKSRRGVEKGCGTALSVSRCIA